MIETAKFGQIGQESWEIDVVGKFVILSTRSLCGCYRKGLMTKKSIFQILILNMRERKCCLSQVLECDPELCVKFCFVQKESSQC